MAKATQASLNKKSAKDAARRSQNDPEKPQADREALNALRSKLGGGCM